MTTRQRLAGSFLRSGCELDVESCELMWITQVNRFVMLPAGYSGTALIKKLGIRPEMKVLAINAPENYFRLLESDISAQYCYAKEAPDLIHLFAKDNRVFGSGMKKILLLCKKNTSVIIWVSWYKKSSGITTDLTEDTIRNFALKHGLVDIKVCAVSNEWSGLKLVVPVSKR